MRIVVATAISLAGFFNANNVLAQDLTYTDASGVTAKYRIEFTWATLSEIVDIPASVKKWVIPEYVTFPGNNTLPVERFSWEPHKDVFVPMRNATLEEVVFPKQFKRISTNAFGHADFTASPGMFEKIRIVTFGEATEAAGSSTFAAQPLDSVVFLGDKVIAAYSETDIRFNGTTTFNFCPATTKIIVPCGKLELFLKTLNNQPQNWGNVPPWTSANFYEAECLNTLTVLSSDVSLGNAISMSGCTTLTTTTPDKTSSLFSGAATLFALPKGGNAFVGWDDGNLDNPRIVNVTEDVTYTATFAPYGICEECEICETCEECEVCEECEGNVTRAESINAVAFKVYPNPVSGLLNVQFEKNVNNGALSLYDMKGNIVLTQTVSGNTAQIDLSPFPVGNYILRLVENGVASASVKIIKN